MQGQIDHNLFVTMFWAFFFSSLALSFVRWAARFLFRLASSAFNWITGNGNDGVRRSAFSSGVFKRSSELPRNFEPTR